MKNLLLLSCLLGALLLGWFGKAYWDFSQAPNIKERSVIIEDQIRKIAQLATAEGHYGQMFNHKETGFLDYPSFNKSVIVDATARVVVGFDLEGISVEADAGRKRLIVHHWPEPSELAYEVDMRYFDLDQGLFNSFDSKELNEIKAKMGEELKSKLDFETLEAKSFEQAEDLLGIIDENLRLVGWHLEVSQRPEIGFTEVPKGE
ncbi:MAG: DUF4230 domain-containing protein [Saprospiraceae bacterium]